MSETAGVVGDGGGWGVMASRYVANIPIIPEAGVLSPKKKGFGWWERESLGVFLVYKKDTKTLPLSLATLKSQENQRSKRKGRSAMNKEFAVADENAVLANTPS